MRILFLLTIFCCFPRMYSLFAQPLSSSTDAVRTLYDSFIKAEDEGNMDKLKTILQQTLLYIKNGQKLSQPQKGLLFTIAGQTSQDVGKYSIALPYLKTADSSCSQSFGEGSAETLLAKKCLSWSYGYNGQPDMERKMSFEMLSYYLGNRNKNMMEIVDLYHTIGFNYGNEGNRADEQQLYRTAIRLLENFNPKTADELQNKNYNLGLIYNSLSISSYADNNYEAALYAARTSLYYRNITMPGSAQIATNWMIIGRSLYHTEGNADSALFYLDKSISLLERKDSNGSSMKGSGPWIQYKGYKADILQKANRINQSINETQSVITFIKNSKQMNEQMEASLIQSYCSLSSSYMLQGKAIQALQVMEDIKNKLDKNTTLPKLYRIRLNTQYAFALSKQKNDEQSMTAFAGVIDATGLSFDKLKQPSFAIPVTFPFEFLSVYVKGADALTERALQSRNAAQLQDGINILRNVSSALERRKAWYFEAGVTEGIGVEDFDVYEKLLAVLYNAKGMMNEPQRLQYAFAAIESSKANLLKSSLLEDNYFSSVLSQQENRKRIDLKTKVCASLKESNETADANVQIQVAKAKENYLSYIQSLKKKYAFHQEPENAILSVSDPVLTNKNRTVVNYFLGTDHLYSFIHQDGKMMFTRSEILPHLNELISYLSAETGSRRSDSLAIISHQLFYWLLKDVKLNGELVIIPHRQLSQISFDMLNTSNSNTYSHYLIEQCAVRYAYAASLLQQQAPRKQHTDKTAFFGGFAASRFDTSGLGYLMAKNNGGTETRGNMSTLSGTTDEVKSIAGILHGDAYINTLAQRFLQYASHYRVLHIATHAFADEGSGHQCNFLFESDSAGNNIVSDGDIASLPLQADMAVLSACNTGLGKMNNNEGMISLGRAFFIAGCPSVIMSLWTVNDESTATIMTAFYKHLTNGETKDEALRQAKLDYVKQQTNAAKKDPYYWAGFIVVGNNSPLQNNSHFNIETWIIAAAIFALIAGLIFYLRRRSAKSFT